MKILNRAIFLVSPVNIGRAWALGITRQPSWRFTNYRAHGLWNSWQILWFRLYRFEGMA